MASEIAAGLVPPNRHGRRVSVVGLGYVGLPVACAFAARGETVIAFDIQRTRIEELRAGRDRTGEVTEKQLSEPGLVFTMDPSDLSRADFHIVTVPTPITAARLPDLGPLLAASRTIGRVLKQGDIVVYESTVYPGATEEECVPVLESESGLRCGRDFTVGYSPERINPGDVQHRFDSITKVVSGLDEKTLETVAAVYGSVVHAGVHRAPSIRVAEAAKVIENTQRDLNIALMNELSLIFDRLGIPTSAVLEAAGTKWNFLKFTPGLVGGHCIGVDPYYLTAKAEAVGYHPQVILAGRRTNDCMGSYVAQKLIKLLVHHGHPVRAARVGILGLTFKENVPDLRNSRVHDIVRELREYGIAPMIHDPLADPAEVKREYGIELTLEEDIHDLQVLVLAVPHAYYLDDGANALVNMICHNGIIIDIRAKLDGSLLPDSLVYWSL